MKKCPYCAEEIQDEAIVCRYCGRDLNAPASLQTQEQVRESSTVEKPVMQPVMTGTKAPAKGNNAVLILVLLIIFVCIIGAALSTRGNNGGSTSGPDKYGAQYICKQFMTDRLKAPSTAKFASFSDSSIQQLSSDRFKVTSYVDAQNSFGAMIRTTYTCTVTYSGNDEWKLVDLTTD